MKPVVLLALVAGFLSATAANAAEVLKKLPAALDPAKAYVVVELGRVDDGLLDASLVVSRFDANGRDIAAAPVAAKGAPEPANRVVLTKAIVKGKDRRLYLAVFEPGLWVIEGANDTSFSLGSPGLTLEAGTVTDLGVANVYSDFAPGAKRDIATAGRLLKGAIMGGIFGSVLPQPTPKAVEFRGRSAGDLPLPALLASARPPVWGDTVRFGNYLGGLVNRLGGRKARTGQAG